MFNGGFISDVRHCLVRLEAHSAFLRMTVLSPIDSALIKLQQGV